MRGVSAQGYVNFKVIARAETGTAHLLFVTKHFVATASVRVLVDGL